jgi:hypothetical protein
MKTFIWIVFAVTAALWTGLAYLSVEALRWIADLMSEGVKAGEWADLATNWSLPSWLLIWVDAQQVQALQLALVKAIEQLQGSWPALGKTLGWLVPLVWGVWALGMLVLLLLAGLGHWLVGRQSAPKPISRPPAAA